MTIAYKENVVMIGHSREIEPTTSMSKIEAYDRWGPIMRAIPTKTKFVLTSDAQNANKDTVATKEKGGSVEVLFTGSQIKASKQCKELGITWYDPTAAPKEQEWSLFDRYR
jgi:hypothetical protein